MNGKWLDQIKWSREGLVPVIAQDANEGKVLMFAWMNRESLELTVTTGKAVYWSRSRKQLWHKGEQSGNEQQVKEIRLDCDNDAILMLVEQNGGISCHTGRQRCFYQILQNENWVIDEPVIKDPGEIYSKA